MRYICRESPLERVYFRRMSHFFSFFLSLRRAGRAYSRLIFVLEKEASSGSATNEKETSFGRWTLYSF